MPLKLLPAAFCDAAALRSTADPTRTKTEKSMPYTIQRRMPLSKDPHAPPGCLGACMHATAMTASA